MTTVGREYEVSEVPNPLSRDLVDSEEDCVKLREVCFQRRQLPNVFTLDLETLPGEPPINPARRGSNQPGARHNTQSQGLTTRNRSRQHPFHPSTSHRHRQQLKRPLMTFRNGWARMHGYSTVHPLIRISFTFLV